MIKIEPHFFSVIKACESACELLEILPQEDIVLDLIDLLNMQYDVLSHMIEDKHFGSNNLEIFINYSKELMEQAIRLKESLEWRRE